MKHTSLLTLMLICAALLVSGCMAELQTGDSSNPASPSPPLSVSVDEMLEGSPGMSDTPTVMSQLAVETRPTDLLTPNDVAPGAPPTTVVTDITPLPVETIAPPTPSNLSHEQRWRNQQLGRQTFDQSRIYTTTGSELWWYDPVNQQHVILGAFSGEFEVQATFTLRGQGSPALEVPYQINKRYGLTSLSPSLVQRLNAAGYEEWVETYAFVAPNVQSR